jgi:D-inositol-3-phosphate glycosyltransferase
VCAQKGTDVLLGAYRHLIDQGGSAELLIAGPVEQFSSGAATRADTEWAEAIEAAGARYLGVVPDERLAGLMTAADVFVMPTVELEMQGMAALEAQACGTPVVATDHGGLPETVPAGCGQLVPVNDAPALSEALAGLLDDPSRLRRSGERALEHARSLSWARICDLLDDAYERAAEARSVPG